MGAALALYRSADEWDRLVSNCCPTATSTSAFTPASTSALVSCATLPLLLSTCVLPPIGAIGSSRSHDGFSRMNPAAVSIFPLARSNAASAQADLHPSIMTSLVTFGAKGAADDDVVALASSAGHAAGAPAPNRCPKDEYTAQAQYLKRCSPKMRMWHHTCEGPSEGDPTTTIGPHRTHDSRQTAEPPSPPTCTPLSSPPCTHSWGMQAGWGIREGGVRHCCVCSITPRCVVTSTGLPCCTA